MESATGSPYVSMYAGQYLEKVFYYCLKKTDSTADAEDLASDISEAVMTQLRRGAVPQYFSAWVWKIASNRYSLYASKRADERARGAELDDAPADSPTPEEEAVRRGELQALRRELAFISGDYRKIVTAFYIEDRKVADIAAELGVPEGTVKTKLFRARKKLKEGMEMAREFGVKSYKPENMRFTATGNVPGSLWPSVRRGIPKNILLAASDNPSTAEELSVELGVAAPYMEEELGLLENEKLIKKTKEGKYLTDFYIMSAEVQLLIRAEKLTAAKGLFKILGGMTGDLLPEFASTLYNPDVDEDELRWFLFLELADKAQAGSNSEKSVYPKGGPGHTWGFIGYEYHESGEYNDGFTGLDGHGGDEANFLVYYPLQYGLKPDRLFGFSEVEALFFRDILQNHRRESSFGEGEKALLEKLRPFVQIGADGEIVPSIAVLNGDAQRALRRMFENHRAYPALIEGMRELQEKIVEILKKEPNKALKDHFGFYLNEFIACDMRNPLLAEAVSAGALRVPGEPDKSNAGVHFCYK